MGTVRRSNIIDGDSQEEQYNRWGQSGGATLIYGDSQKEEH